MYIIPKDMATGEVGILNVGAGDMKLTFDKNNPAETIRAGRIVKDMIRRGYALLIEVEREGVKAFERATDFDEKTSEYIVADFDPVEAYQARKREKEAHERDEWVKDHQAVDQVVEAVQRGAIEHGQSAPAETREPKSTSEGDAGHDVSKPARRGRPTKRVEAGSTRAVAVGRSAGG